MPSDWERPRQPEVATPRTDVADPVVFSTVGNLDIVPCSFARAGAMPAGGEISDYTNSLRAGAVPANLLSPRQPHFAGKAKRVIHIFCEGGPSQVDTFDPKPMLEKYHARLVDEVLKDYQKAAGEAASGMGRLSGKLQRSAFKFARS